jgi:hypothetical protein
MNPTSFLFVNTYLTKRVTIYGKMVMQKTRNQQLT